jgi:hypothetical protein
VIGVLSAEGAIQGSYLVRGARKIVAGFENTSGDLADSIDFQAPTTGNDYVRL